MTKVFIDKMLDSLNNIRHDNKKLTILDPFTTHYNFRSYLECCNSLNIQPSLTKFIIYNELWRNNFTE